MKIVPLDMETFWSPTHSLSKMNPFDYVMHPETELISMNLQVDGVAYPTAFGEDAIRNLCASVDWSDAYAVGHNMSGFDALVLSWRLGIKPKMWGCTLAMARPIHAKTTGLSLAKLVAHYRQELEAMGISGVKDSTALVNTRGRHLKDFTAAERRAMGEYNANDTAQCYGLFRILSKHYTPTELWHLDCKIRALVEPKLVLDVPMLEAALAQERANKRATIMELARMFAGNIIPGGELEGVSEDYIAERVRATLASAPMFSQVLEARGVPVPMKPSPTDESRMVPALAKTDEEFQALQEHDDPIVAAAAQARLAVKSTLAETRMQAFVDVARYTGGRWPVTTHYCGADTTGRASGWHYNPLNLPRVDPSNPRTSDALRMSVMAPPGHVVVVADLSGIEMRFNHFLWRVPYSTQLWIEDPTADIYKPTAAKFFDIDVADVTKSQRQVGKVQQLACIEEGSLVLTDHGLIPIEKVPLYARVWDGVEWVEHDGPVYQGEREVITYDSLTATADHIVYLQDGSSCEFGVAAREGRRIARTGDGRTPIRTGGDTVNGAAQGHAAPQDSGPLLRVPDGEVDRPVEPTARHDERLPEMLAAAGGAPVAGPTSYGSEAAVYQPERPGVPELRREGHRVSLPVGQSGGGVGAGEPGSTPREGAGPAEQRWPLRTWQPALGVEASEPGEPRQANDGAAVRVPHDVPGGSIRGQHAEAHDRQRDDSRADSAAVAHPVVQTKRRVWDILNAGPRHRFTVQGRLVSNCGFGCGGARYVDMARIMGGLVLSKDEATAQVVSWRTMTQEIVEGWKTCERALWWIYEGMERPIDPGGMFWTCAEGIRLPSGRLIRYPHLRREAVLRKDRSNPEQQVVRDEWVYGEGRNRAFLGGPKVDENIVQAGARDVAYDVALDVFKLTGYRPSLEVYDELVYVVPESEAQALLDVVQTRMRTPPEWFPELVTWSEGDIAERYGLAK